ncbi:hypothetical protein BU17DRAFT_85188 [Hysterangium stoloniferum]|nr:hypothetical protein BU17DRAFT_85188 [Hysterangium stoloniferum]
MGSLTARLIVAPGLQTLEVQGTRMEWGMQARAQSLFIRRLEERRAAFGEASRNEFPHTAMMQSRDRRLAVVSGSVGTSILNDSSLPASFTRDLSRPFPPPHLNQFDSRSQRSDRHYSTAMPVYAYPRAPSDYGHFDRQRRSANFETNMPHDYPTDDSHTGRPEVVPRSTQCRDRLKEPSEGNVFAHEGSLTRSPRQKKKEHARSMASKSGTMERSPCRKMTREPEEVYSNMTTLTRRSSIPPTHLTEPKSSKHTTPRCLAFRVSASLKAAAASTVFPTPCGKRINIADFVTFITAADPKKVTRKCKLCEEHIAKKDSPVKHWIKAHAFTDLQVALMHPHEDHSDLVINTTQRRDILLAALYTCPLKGCRGLSQVGVFVTKGDLQRHVHRHYRLLTEASGEEKAWDTEVELDQMRQQVDTYLNNHAFWQKVDHNHFTSRDYKLVWLLNQ